ncbi:aromatase/cyclase [Nocardia sp. 004]|uniref:aromatase/cyclase n=1 Tax=Nocardia sp. 004 TaxID=3385978 RepID=UPI0039A3DCF5
MPTQSTHEVEHGIDIAASADVVYGLIADVTNWPRLFPPTIFVDLIEDTGREQTLHIWATANGDAKSWTSRRSLDPATRRITFRQQVSTPPVASMGGTWIVEPISADSSHVRLLHDYRAVDDDPAGLAWIAEAVDRNSDAELAALAHSAELSTGADGLLLEFEDTVRIDGSARDAFDFINEAQLWDQRLPHVSTVRLHEPTPGLQTLEMDTYAKDGSTHTTKSFRVCQPHQRIAYKQTTLPALMSVHTGRWTFDQNGSETIATSQHTVVLREENITTVLGADAGIAQARDYVRTALSTNSLATLNHAKEHAERIH